jgi:PQQ-like domain
MLSRHPVKGPPTSELLGCYIMQEPRKLFCAAVVVVLCVASSAGQLSVTTWHYDNMRTGANLQETILTPANVVWTQFGKLFSYPVDGAIVGQALYLSGVSIPNKGVHNVVYVATMNDTVYAFDADTNTGANALPLWSKRVLAYGAVPMPISLQKGGNVTGWTQVGVVSTPVIDASTGTLYVLAKEYVNGVARNRLWGLDVASGARKFAPVAVSATFTSAGQTYAFNNFTQINRPALLLNRGAIYIAFGGNGSNGSHQGWVIAYSAINSTSLKPKYLGAFNAEPGRVDAGIWQKGAGPSADSGGNVYVETGEGSVIAGTNFGTSILKMSLSGGRLALTDWFTPSNWSYLGANDLDLNDSVLLLPNQPGSHPYLAIGVGKEGTLYVVDRTNMGRLCSTCGVTDTQIVQELQKAVGRQTGSLVYWNNRVYSTSVASPVMAWSLNNGLLSTTPANQSATVAGQHSPVLSANGLNNGILWQLQGSGKTTNNALVGFDAITLKRIYAAGQSGGRDSMPPLPHFAQLIEVNGKVYVGTNSTLEVFGLF